MRRFSAFLLLAACNPEVTSYSAALCWVDGPTIVSPADGSVLYEATDVSDSRGHQSNVEVRAALPPGAELSLSFITNAGVLLPWPQQALVDAEGTATFEAVSFPEGTSQLRVHHASDCGLSTDAVDVEVLPALTCDLAFSPKGVYRPAYRPRTTFNAADDNAPLSPGMQLRVEVETLPGAKVVLWDLNPEQGEPRPLLEGVADAGGDLTELVDLDDGDRDLEARCSVPQPERHTTSALAQLFVDTVPPECHILTLVEGQVITKAEDFDATLDGTQVEVEAVVTGGDVSYAPIQFEVRAGLAHFGVTGSALHDERSAATVMFWDPGPNRVIVTASDRAGNACWADAGVMYGTP